MGVYKSYNLPVLGCSFKRRTNEFREKRKSFTKDLLVILFRNVKSKRRLLSSNFLESLPSFPYLWVITKEKHNVKNSEKVNCLCVCV